jgi:tetratricopeptide (TPR) repeat protein
LSRNDGLRITASSIVFRFKGQRWDTRQVGRELGVEAILEGSVWRSGDRIRITVNLVGVKDGFNLWAQRCDTTLGDLFGIQDEVCTAVAEALHVRLGAPIGEHRPSNVNAYVLYLKGTHLLKKRTPNDVRRAFEYFREAIRLEPHYAEPYYGAAMYYNVSAAYGALSPRSALPEAENLLSKGLALDKSSVRLHMTLGMLRVFQWRWTEAEQSCQRAISLESTDPFAHITYPVLCSFLGRHEEALLHARKAVELDPLDLMTNFRLLQVNYYARRYEDAVRCGRLAIELTPDSPYTCFYLAFSLAALGFKDEAWAVVRTGRKLNDGLPLGEGYFGFVAGMLGHAIEARAVIGELRARREQGYGAALPIALTYLGLRESAPALQWLETALSEGDPFLGSLMVSPAYDAIRDQPRFKRLAQQLNLCT